MRPWKLLGLAGLAGVAATGAVLARNERERRAYSADDVRARLHQRAATLTDAPEPPPPQRRGGRLDRLIRRLRRR